MIITKYPEWVEIQLKQLDKQIEEIYKQELGEYANEVSNKVTLINYQELQRKQKICQERIKPYLDEKVRLITNSVPTYIIDPNR